MKYLQINTVASYTSIGRIMRQNYDEKRAEGWDCLIAYGRGSDIEGYNTIKIGTKLDYRLQGISTRLLDRHGYGSKKATKKFIARMEEYKPDIIHLHNIHGYYINFEILFQWLKAHPEREVIWTLHDCWAMTGHCAYFTAVKCDKWKTQCLQCPQKGRYPASVLFGNVRNNFERKKRAFTGVKGMTLTVPSRWLESIVKDSFLKEYRVEVVYNKIDTNIFKPTLSNFREVYGLTDKKVILGVANVWDKRKGLNDFIELSQMLDEQYAIVLVGLNKKQMRTLPEKIKEIERIDKIEELVKVYNEADVFVKPNVEVMRHKEKNAWAEGMAVSADVDSLYSCVISFLGRGMRDRKTTKRFLCIGKVANTHMLAAMYSMADVFVNPTYEDNYPTVNLEARACGTPVITYDVGGCRETLC